MIKILFATSVLVVVTLIGASIAEAQDTTNGLTKNAFSLNAFSLNGIDLNGIGANDIGANGVSSEENHLLPLSELAKEAIVDTASK